MSLTPPMPLLQGKYYVTNDPNCGNVIYSSSYPTSFQKIYLCGQCKGGCPQVDGGGFSACQIWVSLGFLPSCLLCGQYCDSHFTFYFVEGRLLSACWRGWGLWLLAPGWLGWHIDSAWSQALAGMASARVTAHRWIEVGWLIATVSTWV